MRYDARSGLSVRCELVCVIWWRFPPPIAENSGDIMPLHGVSGHLRFCQRACARCHMLWVYRGERFMFGPLRRRNATAFLLVVVGLALGVSACGSSSGGTSSSSTAASSGGGGVKGKTIDFVGYGSDNPWGAYFNQVFNAKLKGEGAKVVDLTTMDPGTAVTNFNQAVSNKPDLIVVALLDPASMVVPIKKAKQAGIPVLVYDGRPDPSVDGDVLQVL